MKWLSGLFGLVAVSLVLSTNADATVLFYDDFQTDTLVNWVSAGSGDTGTASVISRQSPFPSGNPYAFVKSYIDRPEASVTTTVNATGYENLVLSYDRATYSFDNDDLFSIGWSISGTDSYNIVDAFHADNRTWTAASFNLPAEANNKVLDIQFKITSDTTDPGRSYGDHGIFDDVQLTGDRLPDAEVPEPMTMSLIGMGVLGMAGLRSRKAKA